MVFSSPIFLFLFFPIFLLFYYALPSRAKNGFLLLGSLVFYAWGEKRLVLVLIASAVCNYLFGLLIERYNRKSWLIGSLIFNIGILFFYKYLNFTFDNLRDLLSFAGIDPGNLLPALSIAIPLGISFLTFRAISYSLDVYRSKITASRNILSFSTYYLMFPPLIAGPIVRYADLSGQLGPRKITLSDVTEGAERFIIGLVKKVLVANTFAAIADEVFATPLGQLSSSWAWIGVIAFFFQIYFDFSGYSDMAIGLGRMMGFRILENFNYPYVAKDIRDFWRRWHISLSTWLRDYLFLPIAFSLSRRWKQNITAGIKTDRLIHIVAVTVTFAICGFWHGPTWGFLFWGIFYGFFIILESAGLGRILKRSWKPLPHLYTLLVILIGWVFFRAATLGEAFLFLAKMFSFSSGDPACSDYLAFTFLTWEFMAVSLIALLFSTPLYPRIIRAISSGWPGFKALNATVRVGMVILLLALLSLSFAYVTGGTHNPFIYSRF